ncbi:MAG: hypothetical protein IKN27_10285 [Selenomonadaceae bacterium]|nr:hypothetical protein [Selenomonadaceae bacterium]
MTSFYDYLARYMPIKRMLISLAVGMVSFFIVLISGLTSEFVRSETVASRTFSAFCFTSLVTFIIFMTCEEYGIYKTKKELENFVDFAEESETDEDFDRNEYLGIEEEKQLEETADEYNVYGDEPEDFRPMEFEDFSRR